MRCEDGIVLLAFPPRKSVSFDVFRFQRRVFVTLPESNERGGMFKLNLGADTHHTIKEHEWMQLAERAEK